MMQSTIQEVIEQHGDMLVRKLISKQPVNSPYKDYVVLESSCLVGAYSNYPKEVSHRLTRQDKRRMKFEETGNPDDLHDMSFENDQHLAIMGG